MEAEGFDWSGASSGQRYCGMGRGDPRRDRQQREPSSAPSVPALRILSCATSPARVAPRRGVTGAIVASFVPTAACPPREPWASRDSPCLSPAPFRYPLQWRACGGRFTTTPCSRGHSRLPVRVGAARASLRPSLAPGSQWAAYRAQLPVPAGDGDGDGRIGPADAKSFYVGSKLQCKFLSTVWKAATHGELKYITGLEDFRMSLR